MVSSSDILNAGILIVDDLAANIKLLTQILVSAGYTSIASTMNSFEVCELHRKHSYDLILLDLLMPGLDGFQVLEGLKKIAPESYPPVLVITAKSDQKLRALQAGAKDFVSKPLDLAEVLARVHNMLEVRLLYKQLGDYSQSMEALALHDALTGLPNRRLLMDRLSLALVHARRNKSIMAVMYLDLDGFNQINNTSGHDAGDTMLKMVAARLVKAVRQEDTVARLGGDEFVIVLWKLTHADDVAKLATKVIKAISQPFSINDSCLSMTVSVGVSIYPTHGEEVETLMKSADLALYEAKRTGKNNFSIATPTVAEDALLTKPGTTGVSLSADKGTQML
ncbi:MAG: diguanylate cyclase response regulator [Deltaproteobacteria bacterium RIFOXYD12_FULL_50_9]|nr:MAG: diguanylate cyclase response regulator [Deltaproteobacteria bacterium RIFOXYD12_FULL_50_9]